MRYLDPKNDLTFKKIFGEHPNLLISLLNSLLPIKDDELIKSIEYLSPELVPDIPLFKDSMVDVRCFDAKGRQFIVEMQMLWTDSFKYRVLFNAAKAYVRQLDKGAKYMALQPVYALSIVNEDFESSKNFYHHYQIVCTENDNKRLEGLEFVFVELPKFRAENMVAKRLNILWLRFLKEMKDKHESKDIPAEFLENPEIMQAVECLQESSFSPEELEYYDKYWDYVSRSKTLSDEKYEQGIGLGKEIGLQEGKMSEKVSGIKKALQRGKLSTEEIAEDFEVSVDFVLKIKNTES